MKTLVLCASFLALQTTSVLAAERSPACAAQQARIESKISEATAKGHPRDVAGLKKALRASQAGCTDQSLANERDRDIRQAQQKVVGREKSLAQAEKQGDAKKIAARRAKLDEARSQLAEAQKPLI